MLFNPHTSSDRGCDAARDDMVDSTADSTADGMVDRAFMFVSDLLSAPSIYQHTPAGSLLARFCRGVISDRAAASRTVVRLCAVVHLNSASL